MWQDIKAVYRSSWHFAFAIPLLFLLPALPEFAQHIAEYCLGMYSNAAGAHAAAGSAVRLGFGYAKVLALLLPTYWFVRYMAWNEDASRAARIETPAFPLWLILFALGGAMQALSLFGPPAGGLIGLTGKPAIVASAAVALIEGVVGIYLTAWYTAWALGNVACGPLTSIKVMSGSFWRTLGYLVACILPLMIVHYALGLGAIGRPVWLMWPMLVLDAIVVAFLALTMAGSGLIAARWAARRKAYPLIPESASSG